MVEMAFVAGIAIAQPKSRPSYGPLIKPDEQIKKAIDDFVWELNKPFREFEADIYRAIFNNYSKNV